MNILRVIPSMDPKQGGPCQGIRNSIPAQEKLGVYNEVLSFDDPSSEFLDKDHFKINAIGPAKGPYSYCSGLNTWLNKNLLRFDAVIIHGLWQYHSYGTYKAWKYFRKDNKKTPPVYVMPHGMLDPYFQKAKSRRLKAIRNWVFWKVVEGHVLNEVSGVLFTCKEELLLARETFRPYHPNAELNVGYGIQPPPAYKKEHRNSFLDLCPEIEGKPYWLYLSRIHPKKGVDMLIRAYLKLLKKQPDIPALVIAGPGLETVYGNFLTKIGQHKKIHFLGMLQGNAKWGAFYGCRAFILPSHQENFGIAVVEAMACKKPVLISDKVNIWREIRDGNGGLICEDTVEGTFKMLKEYDSLSELDQLELGENSHKIYQYNYEIEQAAAKMIESINNHKSYERNHTC